MKFSIVHILSNRSSYYHCEYLRSLLSICRKKQGIIFCCEPARILLIRGLIACLHCEGTSKRLDFDFGFKFLIRLIILIASLSVYFYFQIFFYYNFWSVNANEIFKKFFVASLRLSPFRCFFNRAMRDESSSRVKTPENVLLIHFTDQRKVAKTSKSLLARGCALPLPCSTNENRSLKEPRTIMFNSCDFNIFHASKLSAYLSI